MSDYYKSYDTFYFTKAGQVIPATSAAVSVVASLSVIYFVALASRAKLSTTYHRIIFFLSFADTVSSLASSLTTIPMPKDVMYPFEGRKLGSFETCEWQAFVYFLGSQFSVCANVTLNVYYLCTIRYKMREDRFRKIAEPCLLMFTFIFTLPFPLVLLHFDFLNPSPYESFCSFGGYPKECTYRDDVPCLRGDPTSPYIHFIRFFFLFGIILVFSFIILSMTLIVMSLREEESEASEDGNYDSSNQNEDGDSAESISEEKVQWTLDHSINRRVVLRQAIMYICAFLLTWIFTIFTYIWEEEWIFQILKCALQPLQGFFNALIFFSHKICNIRRSHRHIPFTEALYIVLTAPSEVPEVLLSRVEMVDSQSNCHNENSVPSAMSPYSGDAISLQTPSPSVDLSKALSSAGVSYGSETSEPGPSGRKYYDIILVPPVEAAAARLEPKTDNIYDFFDDKSLEVIDEED